MQRNFHLYIFLLSMVSIVSCYGAENPGQPVVVSVIPLEEEVVMHNFQEQLHALSEAIQGQRALTTALSSHYNEQQKEIIVLLKEQKNNMKEQKNNMQKQITVFGDNVSDLSEKMKLFQEDHNALDGCVGTLIKDVKSASEVHATFAEHITQDVSDLKKRESEQETLYSAQFKELSDTLIALQKNFSAFKELQSKNHKNTQTNESWMWQKNFNKMMVFRLLSAALFYNKFGITSIVYYGMSETGCSLLMQKILDGKALSFLLIFLLSGAITVFASSGPSCTAHWLLSVIMPLATGYVGALVTN